MSLDSIPMGDPVLLDANILVYAAQGLSRQCARLMRRCASGEIRGLLPAHIAAEFAHQLLVEEARATGLATGANPVRSLARRPETVKGLVGYEAALRSLLDAGVEVEPLGRQDLLAMLSLQRQFGLMVNDSLLLAVGQRLGVRNLATADKAFRALKGWKVYHPEDL